MEESKNKNFPRAFLWRRLHSLTGLWLVAFLILHLVANSQAALPVGDDAHGFLKAANDIRQLPYLTAIEILLLAIPFGIHMYWGVCYLFTAAPNSFSTDGSKPALPEYPRNQAYTWQRITSWILLVLITLHVIQMRFLEEPISGQRGHQGYHLVRVGADPGLYPLAERLNTALYNREAIDKEIAAYHPQPIDKDAHTPEALLLAQKQKQEADWIAALTAQPIDDKQVIAVADTFGGAELLMVRETFKNPYMLILYTVLVVSACFHAFNGLWTFMITWGVTLSPAAQNKMHHFSTFLMVLIAFLGLAAVWGTYWINLKQ